MTQNTDARISLLRNIFEALVWELDTLRSQRLTELNRYSEQKTQWLGELQQYDWDLEKMSDETAGQIHMLQRQIIDLEYQITQLAKSQSQDIELMQQDVRRTLEKWKMTLKAYSPTDS